MLTFFIAGYETSAASMCWSWYHLANNPDVEARLHEELDAVLGGRPPTMDDLPKLEYTRKFIEEVMRITPSTWFTGRTTTQEVELWGARIPKGKILLISIPAVHNNPRVWPEPERFDPERFSPARSAGRPQCAYMPFSRGEHTCIGKFFAIQEVTIALATLAARFRAVIEPGGFSDELASGFSVSPRYGLTVKIVPRERVRRAAAWSGKVCEVKTSA
jgi:cytochrome P450